MNSSVTKEFRKQLDALPTEVREQADRAYGLWRLDPYHKRLWQSLLRISIRAAKVKPFRRLSPVF